MANTVKLKRSSVLNKVPQTSDLEYGELAINFNDGKLFYLDNSTTPVIKHFLAADLITLDLATDNGATTTNSITVGGLSIGSAYSLPSSDGSSGQVITTDGSGNLSFTTPSTVSSIDDLSDVDTTTTSPSSGQVLKWDGSNWTPADDIDTTLSLGSASISELGDVNISSVSDGQVLKYDSSTSKWINSADAGGISLTDLSIGTEGAASGSGSLAYNDSTGEFTYTPPDLSGYLTSYTETNDLTAAVTWANVPDANITQTSVTQHQAALSITESQISDLGSYIELTNLSIGANGTASGNGSLAYNDSTGVFTYTPPDLSGYLTSYTETDPIFSASPAYGITSTNITNWNTAHGWGDHASAGYLTSETTTSLTYNPSTSELSFTDETGSTNTIDLSGLLDEDARAIASGTLNSTTGIVTFTRDDLTTFTVDLSALLDDTNLVTSVNGNTGIVVLDTDDVNEGSTNLYYTDARADARVSLQTGANLDLSSKSTTDLTEGTNLYYTDARVDTHLNQTGSITSGYVLSWDGTDYAWVAQSGGSGSDGASIDLGTPSDSNLTDGLLTFTTTTKVTDAIDELNEVLAKLAPAKPPNLSTFSLSLQSSYSATESSTGINRNNVTSDNTPRTNNVTTFWDGESGTLTSEVDSSVTGTRTLTSGDDAGTYGDLVIDTDSGYPPSGNGANFWQALTAYIERGSALSLGEHTMQMKHSTTGDTSLLTFYVDNPTTTTISGTSFNVTNSTTSYVSGVPTLSSGTTFTVDFTVNDAIKQFYNTTRIAAISGSNILSSTVNHQITGIQTANSAVSVTGKTLTVGSNKYNETPSVTFAGYNSEGGGGTSSTLSLTNVRVDTVSTNESTKRKLSGSGQYPTTGYGGTYDSTQALNSGAYVNEMQFINGQFKYPISKNYSSLVPTAGPNYESGMGTGTRWWCYEHSTTLAAISAFTLTINGSSGFSGTETSGVEIYARVDGSSGTSGWINCNSSYPGSGSPTNDGDPAMVFGSSSATSKRVTFGTAAKTGTLYIRIGFPSGSTKYFSSVSISLG